MAVECYRHLIKFNASHRAAPQAPAHQHTFELILYIAAGQADMLLFDRLETTADRFLMLYRDRLLNEVAPFDQLQPTLENLGEAFYAGLLPLFAEKGLKLTGFEISDSSTHSYVVADPFRFDGAATEGSQKISGLMLQVIANQIEHELLSSFAPASAEKPSPSQAPAPKAAPPERERSSPRAPISPDSLPHLPSQLFEKNPRRLLPLKLLCGFLFLVAAACILMLYIYHKGFYPSGYDIFGHLFKSDLMYQNLREGTFYPLYTESWYNGMQPYRYWAPFPYYILAGLQFLAGGSVNGSYILFAGFSLVVGGSAWLLFGWKHNRVALATILGLLWFFLPDNIRVFFSEGNIPRMVTAIILPYFIYFLWEFVAYDKRSAILPVMLCTMLITLSHAMIGAMVGIGAFLFLLFYFFYNRKLVRSVQLLCGMLLSYALAGIWLFPALIGGLLGMDTGSTADVMKSLTYPLTVSLNPMLQFSATPFYFGLSLMAISLIGLFCAGKKSKPSFLTAILVFLGSTPIAVPLLSKLPLNQLLWMMRFTTITYSMIILALFEWRSAKKWFVGLMVTLLIVDCLPGFGVSTFNMPTEVRILSDLEKMKDITKQRIALIDCSLLGSYPSYAFATGENSVNYTYGWAWQGATTANNIVLINTAHENGNYPYVFDRALELGNDTVVIAKLQMKTSKTSFETVNQAAASCGYQLADETLDTLTYHRQTPETFGVVTHYRGLTIGTSATDLTMEYPSFEVGLLPKVDHYTLEELCNYETIYLSGFFYDNKEKAEKLLTMAADAGVRVVIDMNRIPVNPTTQRMEFLGVYAQPIQFTRVFPDLVYRGRLVKAGKFTDEYYQWNTVYLENVAHPTGYSWFADRKLSFSGTNDQDNLIFLGFNLMFHAMQAEDMSVLNVVGDALNIYPNNLPRRELIPIQITYEKNKIIIDSPVDHLNTTLAYQDNFESKDGIENRNNLLYITQKHTEIDLVYPHLKAGLLTTAVGVLGTCVLFYFVFRKKRGHSYHE